MIDKPQMRPPSSTELDEQSAISLAQRMKKSSTVVGVPMASQGAKPSPGRRPKPCCPPVDGGRTGRPPRVAVPSSRDIERLGALFAVLANATRLRLLLALHPGAPVQQLSRPYPIRHASGVSAGVISGQSDSDRDGAAPELCVCDLAALASASQSMTSHQLHLLRHAGLVEFRRIGKHALYRLSAGPHVHLLLDALDYVAAPRAHVDEATA